MFGIGGVALSWLRTYLSDMEQIVLINGARSAAPASVQHGVPHGTVLGPTLFVLYVTPLDDIIQRHSIDHHAFDDTQLQRSCPVDRVHDSISKMQACIDWGQDLDDGK